MAAKKKKRARLVIYTTLSAADGERFKAWMVRETGRTGAEPSPGIHAAQLIRIGLATVETRES